MKQLILTSSGGQKKCAIYIGGAILGEISRLYNLADYSNIFVITDKNAGYLFLDKIMSVLPKSSASVILPSGETAKHIETVKIIWEAMYNAKCDRTSLVINLGGGVVGDIGGFVASTYMRGVNFLNIPTTLLAQVDASIGGKTGVDFLSIKNLIGTFSQPVGVIIDTQTLNTLPLCERISGFAEIVKHGVIRDQEYFEKVTAKDPAKFTQEEMGDIILTSCKIKADIVQKDEMESGLRKVLNFGHTVGHAIESLSLNTDKPLLHGEAIYLGIAAEAAMSFQAGMLSSRDFREIKKYINERNISLDASIKIDAILEKMRVDKKNEGGNIRFTLLKGIGEAVFDRQIPKAIIIKALQEL